MNSPNGTLLVKQRTVHLLLPVLVGSVLPLLGASSAESRTVLLPILGALNVSLAFLVVVWNRDGVLPLFDIGTVTVAITCLYTVIPPLGFWASGLRWTPLSYLPLIIHNPGPGQVAAITWRYVVYLAAFAGTYALIRGRTAAPGPFIRAPSTAQVLAILVLIGGLWSYFWGLRVVLGVDYDPTYAELLSGAVARPGEGLPYVLQQVSHNLWYMLLFLKLAVLILLMRAWRLKLARALTLVWLCAEVVGTVMNMGARTWTVMMLFAALLLYHRLVRPFAFRTAALGSAALLCGLLTYGLTRDLFGGLDDVLSADYPPWATMNEFQTYFGIAYDLYARQAAGSVGTVPIALYLWDVILLVPSQLVPFAKLDPCFGYPVVDGYGIGCVVGVLANAIIGLDWVELALRGLALGALFAWLHRWYCAHGDGFWATLLYLTMCIWSVYTIRASTFYFAYMLVYRFFPLLVAVTLVTHVLKPLVVMARHGLPARAPQQL